MITYEALRKAVNDEKGLATLSPLPDDFFAQAQAYIQAKASVATDVWELESAKRLVQDLVELREKKVLNAALFLVRTQMKPQHLLPEEQALCDVVVTALRGFREKRLPPAGIEMLQDIPAFVGPDMKTYGPFPKGTIIQLPIDVERLFIKRGAGKAREG